MKTYIVLLRGINVGGHKKVPMAELRELLTESGFESVKTYIQSGNIILQTSETKSVNIENKIHDAIQKQFGFEVSVIAKTRDQLLKNFRNCPFSQDKKEDSYFVILSDVPNFQSVKKTSEKTYENEEFIIVNDCLYFYSSVGYGKSKFNMNWFEKVLDVKATSRNYKTMIKLLAMSEDS